APPAGFPVEGGSKWSNNRLKTATKQLSLPQRFDFHSPSLLHATTSSNSRSDRPGAPAGEPRQRVGRHAVDLADGHRPHAARDDLVLSDGLSDLRRDYPIHMEWRSQGLHEAATTKLPQSPRRDGALEPALRARLDDDLGRSRAD